MERKMFVYTDNYGDDNNVRLVFGMYKDNDNLFIGLEEHDEEFDYWDSYCDVTVNIDKLPFLESAINMNYGGQEKINFLIKNGFGELTDKKLCGGMCEYPVFRFNAEKIKKLDADFFEKYALAHGQVLEKHSSLNSKISNAEQVKDSQVDSSDVAKTKDSSFDFNDER